MTWFNKCECVMCCMGVHVHVPIRGKKEILQEGEREKIG